MTTAALHVPEQPPVPSPQAWFPAGLGIASGYSGNVVNSAYYNGKTYFAFCDGDGNARVACYMHATKQFAVSPAVVTGLGADIHCIPSILVRSSDHKIILAVAPHAAAHLYVAISTNAEDVSAWGAAVDIETTLTGTPTCTYANLFQLSGESGKIYLFFRNGAPGSPPTPLCFTTSTDGGATWSAKTTLYNSSAGSNYWAISSDDTARIDFIVSDGSAGNSQTASLYHFYYTGGNYYKSDGTLIGGGGALPLAPASLTKIYDGATNGSVRAPYAAQTNGGNPAAVFAAYNSAGSGSNENYWYASGSGGTWTVNKITDAGATPDATFQEGGLTIDATNIGRVLLSKKTASVWQMFRYETTNAGATWTSSQLSTDTAPVAGDAYNLRPSAPRNAAATLTAVWFFGPLYLAGGLETPAAQIRAYPLGETI